MERLGTTCPRLNFATEGCLNCFTRQDSLIVWASREIYSRLRAPCLVDDPQKGNRVINTPPKRHESNLQLRYACRTGRRSLGMRKADNSEFVSTPNMRWYSSKNTNGNLRLRRINSIVRWNNLHLLGRLNSIRFLVLLKVG